MPHQQTPADPSREAQPPPGQVPGTAVSTFITVPLALWRLPPVLSPLPAPSRTGRRCALRLPAERKNGGASPR